MTLVLGAGRSGLAACRWCAQQGEQIWVFDDRPIEAPPGTQLWLRTDLLPPVHRLIFSPGIPLHHPLRLLAQRQGIPAYGELTFGLHKLEVPWVCGITGTNGKTTVTEMCAQILLESGRHTCAAGNIGVPLCEVALQQRENPPLEALLLELSSYQLEDLSGSLLHAAAWLNLTPDHLDRYGDMQHYAAAKARIANCLHPQAPLLVGEQVATNWGDLLERMGGRKRGGGSREALFTFGEPHSDLAWDGLNLVWQQQIVATRPPGDLCPHDAQNLAAAVWLCQQAGVAWQEALDLAGHFRKGPHRCELVGEWQGVKWINDSKGTNLDAVIKASQSFPGPQILIAGGVHKGFPYGSWIPALKDRVQLLIALGEAAPQIQADVGAQIPVLIVENMAAACEMAYQRAQPGTTVLLSPGCASFDQFRDYAHRGEVFRSCVLQLSRHSDTVETVGS